MDAQVIYHRLKKIGYSAWMDSENLQPGQNWEYEIDKAIQYSVAVILLVSQHSVNKHGYIQKEIKKIIQKMEYYPKGGYKPDSNKIG